MLRGSSVQSSLLLTAYIQAFRKLSDGLADLADKSESFKSKTILGLLRAAPDLRPNLKHVESMFNKPEGSM